MSEQIITHEAGSTSSKVPRLDLIPRGALIRLARRYELGAEKYGRDNWRKSLGDKEYTLERIAHAIDHLYKLKDKIEGRLPDDGDDDVGAILWAGAFLSESVDVMELDRANTLNCSACGGDGKIHSKFASVDGQLCPACSGLGKVKAK